MRNALAIFRKDVRHLWPQVALFLTLVTAQSMFAPVTHLPLHAPLLDITALIPLAWCYLIVIVIQQEKIPGDRQYWLTRPCTAYEVLLAKAVFIVLFMHLPLFISHLVELLAIGMAPADVLAGLLWRQLLLAAMITFPAAAIAAATRNLAQFLLAALAIGGANIGIRETLIEHWTGPGLVPAGGVLVAALAAAAALWMLYARRDIIRARAVLGVAAALFLAAVFTEADEFTPIRMVTGPPQVASGSEHALEASIRLEGAPPTAHVFVDSHGFSSTAFERASIRNYSDGRGFLHLGLADMVPTFQFSGQLELTLYAPRTAIAIPPSDPVQVPGIGVCVRRRNGRDAPETLFCFSPKPRLALALGTSYDQMQWIVPPAHFEIPNLFQAADIYGAPATDHELLLIPARVLARVRGRYNLTGARP